MHSLQPTQMGAMLAGLFALACFSRIQQFVLIKGSNMKIAWLIWDDEFCTHPQLFEDGFQPDYFHKRIRIVYCEVPA